ncbi:hypothetical protein OIO90_006174 [Microbotryomycetes sp. JL221]|nr:hypothetical protein OIO90_006174 [Microbotryomycetes sp. JL221]
MLGLHSANQSRTGTVKVLVERLKCIVTATPPLAAADRVKVVARLSELDGSTIGLTTFRFDHMHRQRFRTRDCSEQDMWCDFNNVPLDRPIRVSILVLNMGTDRDDTFCESYIIPLDQNAINDFQRPVGAAGTIVAGQVIQGGAMIAGATVGGPIGVGIVVGAGAAINAGRALFRNHDGPIKYETWILNAGMIPRDNTPREGWFASASVSRVPGARAFYEMTSRIVTCA